MIYTQRGSSDMGDVTDSSSLCRFFHPGSNRIRKITASFTGSGTGTATMSAKIDDPRTAAFDRVLRSWTVGKGTDLIFHTPPDDDAFFLRDGEELVFEWTNPDDGNITWVLEVDLVAG